MDTFWTVYFAILSLGGLFALFLNLSLFVSTVVTKYSQDHKITNPGFVPLGTDVFLCGRSVIGVAQSIILFTGGLIGLLNFPGGWSCGTAGFFNALFAVLASVYEFGAAMDNQEFVSHFSHISPLWLWISFAFLSFFPPFVVTFSLAAANEGIINTSPFCLLTDYSITAMFAFVFLMSFSPASCLINWTSYRDLKYGTFPKLCEKPKAEAFKRTQPVMLKAKSTVQELRDSLEDGAKKHELTLYLKRLVVFNWCLGLISILKFAAFAAWFMSGVDPNDTYIPLSAVVGFSYVIAEVGSPYLFLWRFKRHGDFLLGLCAFKCLQDRNRVIVLSPIAKLTEVKTDKFDDVKTAQPQGEKPVLESKTVDEEGASKVITVKTSSKTGTAAFTQPQIEIWEKYKLYKPYAVKLKKTETGGIEFDGRVSVYMMICEPRIRPLIDKYLNGIKTPEPMEFMLEVLKFKEQAKREKTASLPDPGRAEMKKIIEYHIREGAASQINIAGTQADQIQQLYTDKPRLEGDEFDQACHDLSNETLSSLKEQILADPKLEHAKVDMVRDILALSQNRVEAFGDVLVADLLDPMPMFFCCR